MKMINTITPRRPIADTTPSAIYALVDDESVCFDEVVCAVESSTKAATLK
jgi:hypothetical protein